MIDRIDHLVLTVESIEASCAFYTRVLGMQVITFAGGRTALSFGQQKINLHQSGAEISPNARHARPGTADLCFIVSRPLEEVAAHLMACGVVPETDVVERTGAVGRLRSIYLRDPDGNLLELSEYL